MAKVTAADIKIKIDASRIDQEIRDSLIEAGWTPPCESGDIRRLDGDIYETDGGIRIDLSTVVEVQPIYELGGGYFEFAVRFNTGLATGNCGKDVRLICVARDKIMEVWNQWKRENR